MECRCSKKQGEKWWKTVVMAVCMVAVLLFVRQMLAGWLLPDGRFLESLVLQVKRGEEPVVDAVFSGILEWFEDD